MSSPEDRTILYDALNVQRDIALTGGEAAANLAWREIDRLLDCLNELNALDVQVETVQ